MTQTTTSRTYPLRSLAVAAHLTEREVQRQLGWSGQRCSRLRRIGLSEFEADRFAVRLGLHPANVWADWWTE